MLDLKTFNSRVNSVLNQKPQNEGFQIWAKVIKEQVLLNGLCSPYITPCAYTIEEACVDSEYLEMLVEKECECLEGFRI